MHQQVTSSLKRLLLSGSDISRVPNLSRSTALFGQGDTAEALYFLEDGLIKLTRSNFGGRKLILSICGPNHLLGDECLMGGRDRYHARAEVLGPATVYRIPWETVRRLTQDHPELSAAFMQYLLGEKLAYANKVELLCLHDVEHRVLYYLEKLAKLVKPGKDGGHALPITQLELGYLVGATRETTSTVLNRLQEKGFVKLSRCLLTVYLPHSRSAWAAG